MTRAGRWRWQIFAVTWLAYVGFYLNRRAFAVTKVELGNDATLGLSRQDMAWTDGAYLALYAVGQFAWGVCGDRYGTRRVVAVGLLGSIVLAAAMGAASAAAVMVVLFGLQGLAQASGWAPLSKNVGQFFPPRKRGTVMGLWSTNYALGGFVASVVASYFGSRYGWRYAFFGPAALAFGVWALFLLFQRDRPEDVGLPPVGPPPDPAAPPAGSWRAVAGVLTDPTVGLLAAVYFFVTPTRYALLFWAPKYLNEKLGTNMLASGTLGAVFELGGPFGMLLAGVLSDKLFGARRSPVAVTALFLAAGAVFAFDRLPADGPTLGLCLFAVGFLLYAADSLVCGSAAVDVGTRTGAATAAGVVNGCGSVGAIVGGTLPGLLYQQLGWDGLFQALAGSLAVAGCLLLPTWNARPAADRAA